MLALRDHGAELNPEEWLSLIRPVTGRRGAAGGTVFVDNAALAAMLATPAGGSFGEHSNSFHADPNHPSIGTEGSDAAMGASMGAAEGDGFDWDAIAKASFRRILEKSKGRAETTDAFELMDETVTYEDVVDEVCASDGSEELCRVVFEEEFRAADGDGELTRYRRPTKPPLWNATNFRLYFFAPQRTVRTVPRRLLRERRKRVSETSRLCYLKISHSSLGRIGNHLLHPRRIDSRRLPTSLIDRLWLTTSQPQSIPNSLFSVGRNPWQFSYFQSSSWRVPCTA